jgi:cell shape-determining protein MreC
VQTGERFLGTGFFSSRGSLEAENSELKTELAEYQAKDADYAAEHDENIRLRTLVNLSSHTPGHAASIISSLTASAYGTFTVDVGLADGITKASAVYTPDAFAIGIISETGAHSSLVTELFAPDATLESVVGNTHIVLEGQGGGNARARVPRDSTIKEGDIVRATSVDAPVGIVEHVESNPNGADKEIYVRIPANLETLTLVYVGRK